MTSKVPVPAALHRLSPGLRRAAAPGLAWVLTLLIPLTVRAADPPGADPELRDLLSLLDDQTQLATKTGMNADFIPGMATVLSGDDLLDRGIRTVWAALALVPGFSQGLEATGERLVLSRGVGFGYASGNIKMLLDGVSMNVSLTATANPVLNIPIEQVERIEVIRGPGSSVYGEYAYAGVVNVITRKQERTLHIQADQGAAAGGGGVWYWQDPTRDLTLSLNVTGLTGDGGEVRVEQDALFPIGRPAWSQAPGPVNDAQRYGGLFAQLRWGGTFATVKLLDNASGDYFGINHFLPPTDQGLVSLQRTLVAEVGRDLRLSETLTARVRLEGLQYQRERDGLYVYPAGYLTDQPITMDQHYRETRYLAAADLHWRPGPRHSLLFGLEASRIDIHEASWDWPALPFPIGSTWLDTGHERRIYSGILQDEFRAGEQVTVTAGLRYDNYSDLGAYLSPRLAAVWRIDGQNILKFQFAQAFRPPTFYELEYPAAGTLRSSEIATYELGYILKRPSWETRLILFHSELTRPISFDYTQFEGYVNNPDARLNGVELEYQQRLGRRVKIDANLSYVDAASTATGATLPGGSALLSNLALLVRLTDRWTTALQARYVGERQRISSDLREPVGGQGMLDLTFNYRRNGHGPTLHVGVKNITGARLRFPDVPVRIGDQDLIYPQDYPLLGRRWWFSVGYAF